MPASKFSPTSSERALGERPLFALSGHCRSPLSESELKLPELEMILTPAVAWEIDRLFNTRPGPALRHELAHGQLGGDDCYHPNVYYASWLIYRLCCLFVLRGWDELVTPHVTQEL
jgi:hypothetical protein